MHDLFTRTLRRRGIQTGSYAGPFNIGRPIIYFVLNPRDTGMIRLEFGTRRRMWWVDWGNRPES